MKSRSIVAILFCVSFLVPSVRGFADTPGLISSKPIFEKAPFPECHASTIEETPSGLVAAWFGGTREGSKDVGIWFSRLQKGAWTAPVEVANGVQFTRVSSSDVRNRTVHRHPCWNPVLYYDAGTKTLLLFFKVGPSPRAWWGELMTSKDDGATWGNPRRLPEDIAGPIRSKPIRLADGTLLCGSSTESRGWMVHFERTKDLGKTWERTGALNNPKRFGAIQPTLLQYRGENGAPTRLQALCRSQQGVLTEVWSEDGGLTWSRMRDAGLPNPNAGADGLTLRDGRQLLVYNHTVRSGESPRGREMLNLSLSRDGKTWFAALELERSKGEYSYPAMIQSADGLVHITYTHRRRSIRHAVVDPKKLKLTPISGGVWPLGR